MIIDSSKTGMESVRKYTSVRRDAYGISSFTDFSGRFKKPGKAQEGSGVTGPTTSAEDPFFRDAPLDQPRVALKASVILVDDTPLV